MAYIMLIDDDENVRYALERMLLSGGHEVAAFESAAKALDAAQLMRFDLVVTDIWMPGIDGLEVIRTLSSRIPHPKIIAISGGHPVMGTDYLAIAAKLGADAIIEKPVRMHQLLDLVSEVLARKEG